MTDIYSRPLLTARDLSRHIGMPESTLDSWLLEHADRDPLVHSVVPERRGWPRIPFVGVVEAHVLRALRELGVSKRDVRRAAHLVREDFGDPYALASRRFATDGVDLFVQLADASLVSARTGQRPIREVVDRYLTYVDWDEEGRPRQLRLPVYPAAAGVVINPSFGWGVPVMSDRRVPVDSVVALWRAGESMSSVAEEFDLDATIVEDVCRIAA